MILNKYIKNINIYLKCGIIILQKSKKEVVEMIIKLDTDSQQTKLINEYLENKELNLIEKIKENIMEIIEDYEDLKTIERAVAEDDGVYYTFDEVLKDLGIDKNEL